MSAVTEIQKALNVIRDIERGSSKEVRLATLALITSTASDIARELRELATAKAIQKPPPPPIPRANSQTPQPQPQPQQQSEPSPFTEPERDKR